MREFFLHLVGNVGGRDPGSEFVIIFELFAYFIKENAEYARTRPTGGWSFPFIPRIKLACYSATLYQLQKLFAAEWH
jgi:hypothetical protein